MQPDPDTRHTRHDIVPTGNKCQEERTGGSLHMFRFISCFGLLRVCPFGGCCFGSRRGGERECVPPFFFAITANDQTKCSVFHEESGELPVPRVVELWNRRRLGARLRVSVAPSSSFLEFSPHFGGFCRCHGEEKLGCWVMWCQKSFLEFVRPAAFFKSSVFLDAALC